MYITPLMAIMAEESFIGNFNAGQLVREYNRLSGAERAEVDGWVRFAAFAGCNHRRFDVACPPPSDVDKSEILI